VKRLNWKLAGDASCWRATTEHNGLDIALEVRETLHGGCLCHDGDPEWEAIPVVTVYATAFVPMRTVDAGTRTDLALTETDVHQDGGINVEPGKAVNTAALALVITAADSGRAALAELAGHAARLGVTCDAPGPWRLPGDVGKAVRQQLGASRG
jgi:hypothetical protein